MATLDLTTLTDLLADPAVRGLSVLRKLQPLGGPGDMVAPPTFAGPEKATKGPRYVRSRRRVDDKLVETCLLDSPASQANRIEEAYSELVRMGRLELPLHQLKVDGVGVLTDLDVPHRAYDAAITTGTLEDGKAWKQSDVAKAIRKASRQDASALLEHAPMILVLGGWDSHGSAVNAWQGRHEKAVWSKVVGVDVFEMERPGGRLDPMGLPSSDKVDLGDGMKKLVDQGLGVVPPALSEMPRIAVTMDHAEQRSVISFGVFRRLFFGGGDRDLAGRRYLAAVGLLGLVALHERGGHLRSECDLVCESSDGWKIRRDAAADEDLENLSVDQMVELVGAARKAAADAGLVIRRDAIPVTLHKNLMAALGRSDD